MSVFWTLFFILLIYLTIPALAVLAKYDIYTALVGTDYAHLPTWVSYWANVDKANPLISIVDVNGDGIVQLAEIAIDGDVLMLATPEIGGLPYVISGLVAAGGLAAALSTADGLLLAISNALSHDIYYKMVDPDASTQKRVTISKLLLLAVAFIAAYAASQKPADILSLVGAAFSLAGSTLFPALVVGVFWKRANHAGALAGMLAGFVVCLYYMLHTNPILGGSAAAQWFHIAPISAGVFGVPAGLAVLMIVSLLHAARRTRRRPLSSTMCAHRNRRPRQTCTAQRRQAILSTLPEFQIEGVCMRVLLFLAAWLLATTGVATAATAAATASRAAAAGSLLRQSRLFRRRAVARCALPRRPHQQGRRARHAGRGGPGDDGRQNHRQFQRRRHRRLHVGQ